MDRKRFDGGLRLGACAVGIAMSSAAMASTLTQNISWTIDRAGTTTKYRVVAYGDSIYAGYYGSMTNAAKCAATTVDAEYLSQLWNADIESVRRSQVGRRGLRHLQQQDRRRALLHAEHASRAW